MSDAHHGINSSTQKYQSTQSSVVLTSCRQVSTTLDCVLCVIIYLVYIITHIKTMRKMPKFAKFEHSVSGHNSDLVSDFKRAKIRNI